jgi:hypothetical protein
VGRSHRRGNSAVAPRPAPTKWIPIGGRIRNVIRVTQQVGPQLFCTRFEAGCLTELGIDEFERACGAAC